MAHHRTLCPHGRSELIGTDLRRALEQKRSAIEPTHVFLKRNRTEGRSTRALPLGSMSLSSACPVCGGELKAFVDVNRWTLRVIGDLEWRCPSCKLSFERA